MRRGCETVDHSWYWDSRVLQNKQSDYSECIMGHWKHSTGIVMLTLSDLERWTTVVRVSLATITYFLKSLFLKVLYRKGHRSKSALSPLGLKVSKVKIQNASLFNRRVSKSPPFLGRCTCFIPMYFNVESLCCAWLKWSEELQDFRTGLNLDKHRMKTGLKLQKLEQKGTKHGLQLE